MMDLSVIVVSWNARGFLQSCLESVLTESESLDLEVLVIDNASHDNSPRMVRELFPEVNLIANSYNAGFARACNQGLRRARGRYVVLLNPDTRVDSGAFDKMVTFLESDLTIGALGPQILDINRMVDPRCTRRYPTLWSEFFEKTRLDRRFPKSRLFGHYLMTYWDHSSSRDVEALSGACLMVRRKVLQQVGLLDENFFMYGEDTDWCYRIREAGWRVFYYREAQVIHLGGQSANLVSEDMGIEALQSVNRFFEKHYSRTYAKAYRALIAGLSLVKQSLFVGGLLIGGNRDYCRDKLRLHRRVIAWALTGNSQAKYDFSEQDMVSLRRAEDYEFRSEVGRSR